MSNKTIQKAWDKYKEMVVIPNTESDNEVEGRRFAFYAGIIAMLDAEMKTGDMNIDGLVYECNEFLKEMDGD